MGVVGFFISKLAGTQSIDVWLCCVPHRCAARRASAVLHGSIPLCLLCIVLVLSVSSHLRVGGEQSLTQNILVFPFCQLFSLPAAPARHFILHFTLLTLGLRFWLAPGSGRGGVGRESLDVRHFFTVQPDQGWLSLSINFVPRDNDTQTQSHTHMIVLDRSRTRRRCQSLTE